MRKTLALLLVFALALSLVPASLAAAPGLGNFTRSGVYEDGQFRDVASGDWFAASVQGAFELGLMKGQSAETFGPDVTLTFGETIALAARLHSIYNGDGDSFVQGAPWYRVYVDYALEHGIIYSEYSDYAAPIYRGDFVYILRNALPDEALEAVNTVEDRALPDVPADSYIHDAVYTFYRAGILTGNDEKGTFAPTDNITRAAVAAIVTRMAIPEARQSVTLKAEPVTLYARGGKTMEALPDEVNAYLAVGWFLTEAETLNNAPAGRIETIKREFMRLVGMRATLGELLDLVSGITGNASYVIEQLEFVQEKLAWSKSFILQIIELCEDYDDLVDVAAHMYLLYKLYDQLYTGTLTSNYVTFNRKNYIDYLFEVNSILYESEADACFKLALNSIQEAEAKE